MKYVAAAAALPIDEHAQAAESGALAAMRTGQTSRDTNRGSARLWLQLRCKDFSPSRTE
jgi:hypothetical protein